jgi:hypothetical protein
MPNICTTHYLTVPSPCGHPVEIEVDCWDARGHYCYAHHKICGLGPSYSDYAAQCAVPECRYLMPTEVANALIDPDELAAQRSASFIDAARDWARERAE